MAGPTRGDHLKLIAATSQSGVTVPESYGHPGSEKGLGALSSCHQSGPALKAGVRSRHPVEEFCPIISQANGV